MHLRVSLLLIALATATGVAPGLAAGAEPLVLQSKVVIDTQGTGGEAFRLLVPKGWAFDGGLTWNTEKFPAEPFTSYTVTSPDGAAVFEQFPHVSLFWSEDPMLQQSHAQQGMEIMPPASAATRPMIASSRTTAARCAASRRTPIPSARNRWSSPPASITCGAMARTTS